MRLITPTLLSILSYTALISASATPEPTPAPGIIESGISHLSTYLYGFTTDPYYLSVSSFLAPPTLPTSSPTQKDKAAPSSSSSSPWVTNEWLTAIAGDVKSLLNGGTLTSTATVTATGSGAKATGTVTKNWAGETGVPRAVIGAFGVVGAVVGML